VNRGDLRAGEVHTRIVGLDRWIVPCGDLALEDLCRRVRAELQAVDTGEVEDDRKRRDVVRDLKQLAALLRAALGGVRQLGGVECRVAAGKGGVAARDELIAAAARADRVVGHRGVRVLIFELGGPGFLRRLLGAGTGARDGAGGTTGAAVVARTAGGGGERKYSRGS
jgi:hypothetical protein